MQTTLDRPLQIHELNGMRYLASSITMVSVFPVKCEAVRHIGQTPAAGITKYVLPAAEKGSYTKLVISDGWYRDMDFNRMTQEGTGALRFLPMMESANNIARDLFQEWVVNRLGCNSGLRPGIAIIDGDEVSDALLAQLNHQQSAYFEALYTEAQGLAATHNHRQISDLHRAAAKWLGQHASWVPEVGSGFGLKACWACAEMIKAEAKLCRFCRSDQAQGGAIAIEAVVQAAPVVPVVVDETIAQQLERLKRQALEVDTDSSDAGVKRPGRRN